MKKDDKPATGKAAAGKAASGKSAAGKAANGKAATAAAGSDLEALIGKRAEISKQDLNALVAVTRQPGVKIQDFWIKGKPGIDVLGGSVRVDRATATQVIQRLMEVSSARLRFEVFPIGIIDPEEWDIKFSSPGGQ